MFEKLDSIEDAPFDLLLLADPSMKLIFRIPSEWRMLYL